MEKRRRQRINDCLVQLKSLVLQAMNKDTTQYSKLEKADILEMTVKHLKLVQRQQMTAAMTTDPNAISKYRAGFNECAAEIARYLDNVNGGNPDLKSRVMNYLGSSMLQFPVIPVYQGVPYHMQMTSQGVTSQGFPHQSFTPLSIPVATNTSFSQHYQQSEQLAQSSTVRNVNVKSQPLLISPIKIEPSQNDVTACSSHMTSPIARVSSPCDSDSGLSDSSTSFSHDENGNYSHFNVNNQRPEFESRLQQRPGPRSEFPHHVSNERRSSPKRKLDDAAGDGQRKRQNVNSSNFDLRQGRDNMVDESMWRPW
ncbi:hairy/enhancer-of-split related with YRPW motif protein 1-like isoform X2 [Mya arenaria]|nr:hairy/enhancer-of-split related with YRPW motif protein 1-like isoform X2 [Mya arenaria]